MSSMWQTGNPSTSTCLPGILEPLNAWRKHQVEIERAVLQLNEVLAAPHFHRLRFRQHESQVLERAKQSLAVCFGPFHEQVRVLGCVRVSQQDRAGFANEE